MTSQATRAYQAYVLVCILGVSGIALRSIALHYAHKGMNVLARSVSAPDSERLEARAAAHLSARVSDTLTILGLVSVVAGGVVWAFVGRKALAGPSLPVLLLILYVFLSLLMV